MALIGTIRKNFWFVLLLLGFALAAFVLMDMMGASNPSGGINPSMGSVAGKKINYNEFRAAQSALYNNSGADPNAVQDVLWNYFVEDAVVSKEADALGFKITTDELMELQFGENISPIIQQNFRDPQTGQVNMQSLQQFKQAIENGDFTNPQMRAFWGEQEKQIIKTQKQNKLSQMVAKGIYTPTWMVEENNKAQNATMDINYVKIPFTAAENQNVEISDSDIQNYMNNNKTQFKKDVETRVAEYIVFDVIATPEDSMKWKSDMSAKIESFKNNVIGDSVWIVQNSGTMANYFFGKSELPEAIKDVMSTLTPGEIYGPYIDNGTYSAVKLIEKRVLPDSVKASHILRRATDATQIAAAQAYCDSLLNEIKRGRANFADLAKTNSEDPGSGAKGGDLGYFVQGAMVPEFNNFCFLDGKEGEYGTVVSQFGVHLIHIKDQKFLDREDSYKVANFGLPIIPTEDTQAAASAAVADLIGENRTMESLKAAIASRSDLKVEDSPSLNRNDYTFGPLGSGNTCREMVRWMFDSDVNIGDVSPEVYAFSNPRLYYDDKYVAMALKTIEPAGMMSVASARGKVETILKNKILGESIISKVNGSDLNAVASQFGAEVASASGVNFSTAMITNAGVEPKVVGALQNMNVNDVTKPIIGNSGVYLAQITNKVDAPAAANIPFMRNTTTNALRNSVNFKLIEALKNKEEISDKRYELNL